MKCLPCSAWGRGSNAALYYLLKVCSARSWYWKCKCERWKFNHLPRAHYIRAESFTHTHTSISWKTHVWLPLRRRILNVTQANGRTSMWQALPVCVWQVLPVAQQIMQILDVCVQIAPNCKRIKSVTYFVAEIHIRKKHTKITA